MLLAQRMSICSRRTFAYIHKHSPQLRHIHNVNTIKRVSLHAIRSPAAASGSGFGRKCGPVWSSSFTNHSCSCNNSLTTIQDSIRHIIDQKRHPKTHLYQKPLFSLKNNGLLPLTCPSPPLDSLSVRPKSRVLLGHNHNHNHKHGHGHLCRVVQPKRLLSTQSKHHTPNTGDNDKQVSASIIRYAQHRSGNLLALLLLLSGATYAAAELDPDIKQAIRMIRRSIRTLGTMAIIALDYKWTWFFYLDAHPEYEMRTSEVHMRCAQRVLHLCRTNRGLFIKVGQYMSSMSHSLPHEYVNTLRALQDDAPRSEWDDIVQIFQEDMGKHPHEVFASFDPEPIASASLAQVHIAYKLDGEKVAVKIQHPTLRKDFEGDMWNHEVTLKAAGYLFDGFDLGWMHNELESNLRKELDFENEGLNAEHCASNFENDSRVYVPSIHWNMTTKRILCMEFIEGTKITDADALINYGATVKDVVKLAIEAMSKQIFWHGHVHADPHPGNLFIQGNPDYHKQGILGRFGRWISGTSILPYRLAILDHGLYRDLPNKTRLSYCQLWRSLVLTDIEEVKAHTVELGVDPEYWQLFAMAVLMRPYAMSSSVGLTDSISAADRQKIRKTFNIHTVLDMMKQMPRPMLLILRNQNYIRALNYQYGIPVNRFKLMARIAAQGAHVGVDHRGHADQRYRKLSFVRSIRSAISTARFELYLLVHDIISKIASWYFRTIHPTLALRLREKQRKEAALMLE
jgi:aarF domain-containing kinase